VIVSILFKRCSLRGLLLDTLIAFFLLPDNNGGQVLISHCYFLFRLLIWWILNILFFFQDPLLWEYHVLISLSSPLRTRVRLIYFNLLALVIFIISEFEDYTLWRIIILYCQSVLSYLSVIIKLREWVLAFLTWWV
jgi:hypothetical protein